MTPNPIRHPKFRLGILVATPNALACIPQEEVVQALARHVAGDWGELCKDDTLANEQALVEGTRLLSVYHSRSKIRFYIITEADRSSTTVLLPQDY